MKFNKNKTSSRRKNRKAYFNAPSHVRRTLMRLLCLRIFAKNTESDPCLSVKTMKYRLSEDTSKVNNDAKCSRLTGKKYVVHIERIQREKANGATVHVGILPSKVVIMKLKLDKDRKRILEHRAAGRKTEDKGKITEAEAM